MTENLIAGAELYSALGLKRGIDWDVTRTADGTPVAKCLTEDAWTKAHNTINAVVGVMSGGWWADE